MIQQKWETHELMWRMHAKTPAFRRKVEQARGFVEQAKATGERFAVSYSGGKDSTAMLHLVATMWPGCPVVTQFDDCDWPTKAPYIASVADKLGITITEVRPDFSVWEAAARGRPGLDHYCSQAHSLTKTSFLQPLNDAQERLGCAGVFIGLRAEEGKARMMNAAKRGALYEMKSGQWRCMPLTWWTPNDVFAYHIANDLPINPCYKHNAFRPPQDIRVSWALPTPSGYGKDEMAHLAKYYPAQFRKIRQLTGD